MNTPTLPADCIPTHKEEIVIEVQSNPDSEGRRTFSMYWRTNYNAFTGEYSPEFGLTKAQVFFAKVEPHQETAQEKGKSVRVINRAEVTKPYQAQQ